mmetsp:Transcript_9831/g.20433  ORF Transcript_9831/g.20433 Transcript_9831/m.20433 type:complete len:155 (-) Transcript_9831:157-621(-)|eukprot:CAMPEP_0197277194 /NCGR_PEP_ID=MMETSP1432-20130617/16723_1 /TAXON_ID=44447 /ORGANISM="Pseudo-nitzschia delicatissima, Strain UNC1205" /LENGTH=154 /DNA_ID=CAMNT_0042743365 /DNA_START=211 /DNA_END=675 /DNA_ORIENTATION=+
MTRQSPSQKVQTTSIDQEKANKTTLKQKNGLLHPSIISKSSVRVLDSMEDLETGDGKTITTTDRNTDNPIAVAIPLGIPPCHEKRNVTKTSNRIITAPKPTSTSPIRFDESNPAYKTTLAVLCSATVILGCAVIGTLVAKGVHHHQVFNYEEGW